MKSFPLVWAALWRKPARTMLTMLGVVIAFLLFGLLQGVDSSLTLAIEGSRLDRLFTDPRFQQPLPLAYRGQIEKVPGVIRVTQVAFLPGYYQDQKNGLLVVATDPAIWLAIRPEYRIPKEQINDTKRLRIGVVISSWMAEHNGWKIGDQFTVKTPTAMSNGSSDWTFQVTGIMTYSDPRVEGRIVLANFEYYDEARAAGQGTVSRFLIRINDPRRVTQISRQIDALFANSSAETRTQSERERGQSDIARLGDIGFFTHAIIGAVFFTLLILTANTMMESVRERTSELAVLKTMGYSDRAVLGLVLIEALTLCVVASLVGLGLSAAVFPLARSFVGSAVLPAVVVVLGLVCAVLLALASAGLPAWRAVRLRVIDALAVR